MADSTEEEQAFSISERNFARQVRRLREKRGWNQTQLVEAVQQAGVRYMNQSTLSRIENLTRPVRLVEAEAIAKVFGRSISSMTDPEGPAGWMVLFHDMHEAARMVYTQFREVVYDIGAQQAGAEEQLEALRTVDPDSLEPEARDQYEFLLVNLEQFVGIQLVDQARALVDEAKHDYERGSEAPPRRSSGVLWRFRSWLGKPAEGKQEHGEHPEAPER